jgi:hypothetical protein
MVLVLHYPHDFVVMQMFGFLQYLTWKAGAGPGFGVWVFKNFQSAKKNWQPKVHIVAHN